ncbi:Beta-barrel assembly-enhancing protease [Defluviimonas aquaemixtae]|uniref:Beta-barrel assembly-enhancing protease n=1 Tax=Albidovulum aquaemixtae TaxID=1542388 RepID=A0A2R8BL25_9RHOB|nr:tetratricopeptide repeat protein [Defluviimonas aquaemixtae]SPH24096.1 Beta-barrel assembly-enhancing protease [Defluviimonas aquaemixtae]
MAFRKSLTAFALALGMGVLAACDTAEERAEKHYQSGLEYLEAGDVDRALVEFRNVFKLNGRHREARLAYAEAELDRGRVREAFAQYLRLFEQFPEDHDTKAALARLAAQSGDWPTALRYARLALIAAPDDQEMQAIRLVAEYGEATEDSNVGQQIAAAKGVRALVEKMPDNLLLKRVIIDDHIRAQRFDAALEAIDAAIALAPDDRSLHAQRLSIYAALGDDAAVEAGLRDMVARFPDSPEMSQALARWYLSRKEFDKAETHLRSRIDVAAPDQDTILELVRFLAEFRGPEAAVAELDRVIAAGDGNPVYRAARAGFTFDLGQRDQAIADMQDILKTATPSADTRRTKIGLARMLAATGNAVGARALVEEVLEEDAGDGEALKLKASWLIGEDEVGEAIAILRRAHGDNPDDAGVLTLMAMAYERDGNRDLLRESLSRAVVASNRAPEESLRYAQLLAAENKLLPAESVLIDALRLSPGNQMLLEPLGQLYLRVQDWPRAEAVADELERVGESQTTAAAQSLRAAIFAGQEKTDQAIGYLQGLVDTGRGGLDVKIAILRAHLANGQNGKALAYSESLLANDPNSLELRFVDASVRELAGQTEQAEIAYRDLIAEDPALLPAWMALTRLVLSDRTRVAEAEALIDEALVALPDAGELKWAKASFLEQTGDIDGSIAIYEELYKANSANPIIANNLASLLSTHRSDPDSLARAEVIARRLRGSTLAPYQDTYGWIAYLRGNYGEALKELEPAAEGLNTDPVVQYHLGMTYLALERKEDALVRFRKALDLAGPDDSRPDIVAARQEVARLEAEGVNIAN